MDAEKEKRFRFQMQYEQEQAAQSKTSQTPTDMSGSFPEAKAVLNSDASLPKKAWDALQVPSQMASRGLNAMAQKVPNPEPTGDLPMDILKGTPRIAANTIAQAAPWFIDRTSLLLAGGAKALQALRPVGSAVGGGVAAQLESATGANAGSLGRAWNDPSLIFSRGRKAASPLYEAGKAEAEGASIFKGMFDAREIVDKGQKYLNMGGKLEPAEALVYRKSIDAVSRSRGVVKDALVEMRGVADQAVKASENMSSADKLFQRGLDAESLRKILPQNKYGGVSAFKTGIMSVLGPSWAGLLSPAVHGVTATAGGAISRIATNPSAAVTSRALITQFVENRIHEDNQ